MPHLSRTPYVLRRVGRLGRRRRSDPVRRSAMYAVVRRYEGVTDPAEAGRQVNEGFLPLLRQVQGFVAYYWVDAGGGVMVSTSVFQDPASAEESTERAG